MKQERYLVRTGGRFEAGQPVWYEGLDGGPVCGQYEGYGGSKEYACVSGAFVPYQACFPSREALTGAMGRHAVPIVPMGDIVTPEGLALFLYGNLPRESPLSGDVRKAARRSMARMGLIVPKGPGSLRAAAGDIWHAPKGGHSAVCVTTNGVCKKDGSAVMWAGIAKQARDRYRADRLLGERLRQHGNHVQDLGLYPSADGIPFHLVSFPTKHHWRDGSDLELIKRSARELVMLADREGFTDVSLTPPGCALGGLEWEGQVCPALYPILDARFSVFLGQEKLRAWNDARDDNVCGFQAGIRDMDDLCMFLYAQVRDADGVVYDVKQKSRAWIRAIFHRDVS